MSCVVVLCGCGDDAGGTGGSDTATTVATTVATTTVTTVATTGASDGGSTLPTTGEGTTATSGADSTGTTTPIFDLGAFPDLGIECDGTGDGTLDFSYIWIANSAEGTISKINTETLVEEGRYIVRPDKNGSPSRTSVSLSGDVAVANRNGGLTKVFARPERCVESNGMPGIQTSTDGTYLPWGVEECVAWYTAMDYPSQRPVAWTHGTYNAGTCTYEGQKVWTSGNKWGEGTVDVLRVDGDTGEIEATVMVSGLFPEGFGIYGGAVDEAGNFWGTQYYLGTLVFVDYESLQFKTWPMEKPGYGMTVDSEGYVWTCSEDVARFDPMSETWTTVLAGEYGGCMEDGMGTLYKAGGGGVMAIDTTTLAVKQSYDLPEHIRGISVDFHGYIWGVGIESNAYRVDPKSGQFETFSGLVGAYTYSDMTGFALRHAGTPAG